MILVGGLLIPSYSLAAEKHELSFRAVECPMSNYESETGDNKYWACFDDYAAGNLDAYVIENNDVIDPRAIIMFIVDYTLGSSPEVIGLNSLIKYDSNSWIPIIREEMDFIFSYYEASLFPKSTRGYTTWITETRVYK